MFVTESFKGLSNGFQTRDLRQLAGFGLTTYNLAVLDMNATAPLRHYADGLDLNRMRINPYFEMQVGHSKLCAQLKAGAGVRDTLNAFGNVLPDRTGRFSLLEDLTFKKDIAAATLGTDACDVTLFIKRPPSEGTFLHRDASPFARFFTLYTGEASGFVPDGRPAKAFNNYGEHDDADVKAALVRPPRYSLYGFKGESVPPGHKGSTHIEPCADDSRDYRLGAMFTPPHSKGQRPEDLQLPDPREMAKRLRQVYDKWGMAYRRSA